MTLVQKTLVAATVAVVLGAGVYEAHQATQLRVQVQTLQQQQAPLADQLRQLQKERDALTNELVDLRAENSQLKSGSNQAELLKLRGEVTRLKSVAGKNENDPMESAAKDLVAKVEQFKKQVDQWPEKKIPELQFLTPTDWLNASQIPQFTNDISARSAISELRMAAKNRFARMLAKALRDYTQANGGELPNDLSQLKPFFDPPVGDDILGRYNLLHTGKLSDVPSGDMLVSEKTVVDERFDSLYSIAPNRFSYRLLIGDGIRGPSPAEVNVYIQGSPEPHVSIKAPR
jgi:outer membrane murein-binding lipoprotein Lpp